MKNIIKIAAALIFISASAALPLQAKPAAIDLLIFIAFVFQQEWLVCY